MSQKAAFFRFEGTLSPRPTLAAAAWLAGNSQRISQRLARLGNVALAAPFLLKSPFRDPTVGGRMAFMGLRGMSDDRLVILGEDYSKKFITPHLREVGVDLVKAAQKRGDRVVLISDNLACVVDPVAKHLGIDDVLCNTMEFRDDSEIRRATGRLNDPVISGHVLGAFTQKFAAQEGIDLSQALAYGANADDRMLLTVAGSPCAVHPDGELRRAARDLSWPVVEGN